MLKKTEGIVLNFIKYGDTSIIVRIFTKDLGLQSYIVNGARSSKGKGKISLYQHFTIVDLVVYHQPNKVVISRIAEIKNKYPHSDIPFNQSKISITLFITDLLTRCLPEQDSNIQFYTCLEELIIQLDKAAESYQNVSIFLIIKLIEHLGLLPHSSIEILNSSGNKGASLSLQTALGSVMHATTFTEISISGHMRRELTDILIVFLGKHFDNLHKMQSLEILREISQ